MTQISLKQSVAITGTSQLKTSMKEAFVRTLNELLETQEPALALVEKCSREAELPVEILPTSVNNGDVLVELRVTIRGAKT